MAHPRLTRLLVQKLKGVQRIKELLSERYEFVDDRRCRIRREEAVDFIATKMGTTVYQTGLRREVRVAAAALGWDPIAPFGARMFSCVKKKDHSKKEALRHSRASAPSRQSGTPSSETLGSLT